MKLGRTRFGTLRPSSLLADGFGCCDWRRQRRRRMAMTALLAGTLLMAAAGCGGQAQGSGGSATPGSSRPAVSSSPGQGGGTATPSTPGAEPTSPAPTAAADTVSLPVVSCPTTVAIAPTPTPVALPSSRAVAVTSAMASGLAIYADTQGTMELVGPKGWRCAAAYGADGSGGVVVYPPGTPAPRTANAVWKLGQTTAMGIYGTESSACSTCTLSQACPLFPAAAKALRSYLGHGCPARPAAETVTTLSSGIVSFEDPAGVHGDAMPSGGQYPANAVMTYHPGAPDGSWLETCTLPSSDRAECTAVLNTFITWYGAN
jgi:hypothetical protein